MLKVVAIIILYLVLIIIFNIPSKKLDELNGRMEQRGKINNLLATLCFSVLLVVVLNDRTNQIAEQQVNIADRETAPVFQLEKDQDGISDMYKVVETKGMASYVTLMLYEHYYFTYQGEQYEVNLTFNGEEIEGKMSTDSKNPELTFQVQKEEFDKEEIRESAEKYVQKYLKNDDIHVYSDEYVKLSFFDYKNDRVTFQFSEYDNKLKLISTEDTRHIPPHNITSIFWKGVTVEKQLQRLMEDVINMK